MSGKYMRWMIIVALLAISAWLVAACNSSDGSSDTTDGDVSDGDATDGDATDGDATDGDATDGDTTDGDDNGLPTEAVWPVLPDSWEADASRKVKNVHLTFAGDPSRSIAMNWATTDQTTDGYVPMVWFAPVSEARGEDDNIELPLAKKYVKAGVGNLYEEVISLSKTRRAALKAGADVYASFEAEVDGLQPETEYYYRVGTWEDFDIETGEFTGATLSDIYKFKTGIPKGKRAPFRFMLCGDSRGSSAVEAIAENIDKLKSYNTEFWLFNGDANSYGKQSEWDEWFTAMGPVAQSQAVLPQQGNHEMYADVYYGQFDLPKEPDLSDEWKEQAYSFDYANVHFITLNSITESVAVGLKDWLQADLEVASQDPDIDWIIVMTHFAAYSACPKHGSTEWIQSYYVPLFEQYGVDLAYSGHDHNYERSVPIMANAEVPEDEGIIYLVAGSFYTDGYSNGFDWWTAHSVHGDDGNYVVAEMKDKTLTLTAYYGNHELLETYTMSK